MNHQRFIVLFFIGPMTPAAIRVLMG